ncbi:TIGR00266 family protein [Microbacterium awajiense]|uniref:TIGR00266 family protein n=1 Tax=Microbacterium awajiense TaxID=415214 RepID=A0ABP7A1R4_9MICO
MDVTISAGPAFAMGTVTLPPGGSVRVEAGAMAMTRGDIRIETSAGGGFLKGLRRTFGGSSFFVNDFHSDRGGQVGVSATLPGDMAKVAIDSSRPLLVQSGSWSASDPGVDVDSKWGGAKGFFSGAGLVLLRCTGQGELLLSTYGAIVPADLAAGETMTVDNGHVVAFDEAVQYKVRKAGSWKSTILGGEGLVAEFTGPGRVWMQTRSTADLISWIQQVNPQETSNS